MDLISRSKWNAKPSKHSLVPVSGALGVKVHWEGTPVPASLALADGHSRCDDRVRAIQASHMANPKENYSDIAYHFVVCPHGSVFEGRGLQKRTAANGDVDLNEDHYAVLAMLGPAG
ncbi:N-acetylmuramoyl-L-alanine amidase, partial [Streptomyces sp. MBT56]|nr:N-acetylmuramoyl-L-alanine amidase [Streptomyces sp. MBT56]